MEEPVDINKYKRGDIFKGINPKHNSDKIIQLGDAAEVLMSTDGWKELSKWMAEVADGFHQKLLNVNIGIDRTNDIRILVIAYKGILSKPQEWINNRNSEKKKIENNRRTKNGR